MWSEYREGHGGGYGVVGLAGVAEGSDEAVMRFYVRWVGGDGGAEGLGGFLGLGVGEQFEGDVGERVGGGWVGHGWSGYRLQITVLEFSVAVRRLQVR